MKTLESKLLLELLPSGRKWLIDHGYLIKNESPHGEEYTWTEKGHRWIDSLGGRTKQQKGD